jgi:hypothetical protein
MVGHSPIPRFDSTFCGETIVSKTALESGYLYELIGTAVGAITKAPPARAAAGAPETAHRSLNSTFAKPCIAPDLRGVRKDDILSTLNVGLS